MEHISKIMAHMVESDHFKPDIVTHYCPVEKRTVNSDYCDSIHCEMCGDDECLGVDTSVEDMNYELIEQKYFD